MKNSTKLISMGLGLMMVGSSAAFALSTDTSTVSVSSVRPNSEFYTALENKDFSAYSTLYTEKTGETLTQEAFNKILELHNLRLQEKTIKDELDTLGVKMPGFGRGERMGRGEQKGEMMNNLTDEQRTILQNAHALMLKGDTEAGQKLLDDAGMDIPLRNGGGRMGKGIERNND